jgi:hypothetical protein
MSPIKNGSKVICTFMPRNYTNRLTVGKEYVVTSIGEEQEWLTVSGSTTLYEAKYFRIALQERPIFFKVVIAGGHTYRVRCTQEAMKELAEFIGDDHLVSVESILPALRKKTA